MASESSRNSLWAQAICPICVKYFTDPVTLDCRHNFCQACIARYWEVLPADLACPLCSGIRPPRNLRSNRPLVSFVEVTKQLVDEAKEEIARRPVCETHQNPASYFCEDDQVPLCAKCDVYRCHRTHTLVSLGKYKHQIQGYLDMLWKMRAGLVSFTWNGDFKSQEFLKQTEIERKKTVAEFKRLHQILEEQERLRLASMVELEKDIVRMIHENVKKASNQITVLDHSVLYIGENYDDEENTFLQDFGSCLHRFEEDRFEYPPVFPSELKERIKTFSDRQLFLEGVKKEFNDEMALILKGRRRKKLRKDEVVEDRGNKVNVTLDSNTAHPFLLLSKDLKSVQWSCECQNVKFSLERYNMLNTVLGQERFSSGRHWWEVKVEGAGRGWVIGVIKESVKFCTGEAYFTPAEGIWVVGKLSKGPVSPRRLLAFNQPEHTLLFLSQKLETIRVCLDYEEGRVAFFSADTNESIFVFHQANFSGVRIRPYFSVWGSVILKC